MTKSGNYTLYPPLKRKILPAVISGLIAGMHTVHAEQGVLDEIYVTATKEIANIQDIPQAIQVFTTATTDEQRFQGIEDYGMQITSMSYATRQPLATSIIFRGISASGIQYGTNPSSGIYLDEQPITTAGKNPNPRIIDVLRIEALSGPQGTLFGDASQSGTLRIITNKAETSNLDGWLETAAGKVTNGGLESDISGMINIPLVDDKVAIRLVGFTTKQAGYIDNVLAPNQFDTFDNTSFVDDDINSGDQYGGRASLYWEINEDWNINAATIFQNQQIDGFTDINTDVKDLEQVRFNQETAADDWYQVGLTLEGDIEWAETIVTAAYFHRDIQYDADATDYLSEFQKIHDDIYPNYSIYDFNSAPHANALIDTEDNRWSLEGRLAITSDSGFWSSVVGAFYSKRTFETFFKSQVEDYSSTPAFAYLNYDASLKRPSLNGITPGSWQPTDSAFGSFYDQNVENTALFGETTFQTTEQFKVLIGGRWFETQRDYGYIEGSLLQGNLVNRETDYIRTDGDTSASETGFVPKINLTYEFNEDRLIYFTYSEGFRSGGGNLVRESSVIPNEYKFDTVDNLEIGVKSTWLDNSLRLNFLTYQMTWDNFQIQVSDPQPNVYSLGIVNFPQAEVQGFETELAWAATSQLLLGCNLSIINAEISEDATLFDGLVDDSGNPLTPITATKGTDLPITPKWKGTFSINYSFLPIDQFKPYVRFDYIHVDESVNALQGLESVAFDSAVSKHSPYDIADFKLGIASDVWNGTFFIDNLTDERAEQFANNRWGKQRLSINKPRTIGLSIRRRFN